MARQVRRISELPEATELTGDELLEIVQDGGNKRVTVDQINAGSAVLRQDLADPDKGAAMVAYGNKSVSDALDQVAVVDYAPGITLAGYNQLVRDENGEFWRLSGQVELPYTTTGTGIPEDDALVPAGDAVLRQDIHKGMSIAGPWAVDGSAMREPLSSSAGISLGSEKVRPMVTFIDDDGRSVLLSKLRPLYDAKGVKPGISIPTGKIGQSPYITWDDVRDLYDSGWEIMSHTVTERNLNSVPDEELEQELRDSRLAVESRGMKIESFVPPFGGVPAAAYPLIRKYYRASFVTREGGVQPTPIDNYRVHRKNAVEPDAADNPSLQELKDSVDLAIASNSWLVLTTHANYSGLDETQIGVLSDLIDYIRSQGVDIVTPSEGLNVHGNLIDTGTNFDNLNPDTYFKIDRNGEAWPLKTKFAVGTAEGLNLGSPLTEFEDNCITVLRLTSIAGSTLPGYLGSRRFGVLRTVKHSTGNVSVGHQEFFATPPGITMLYKGLEYWHWVAALGGNILHDLWRPFRY